jgi:hypothetical protein
VAPDAPPPHHVHRVALTFGPILLVTPRVHVLELNGEISLNRHVGVTVVLGGGEVIPQDTVGNNLPAVKLGEIGASAQYYLWHDFDRGIELGGLVRYVHATADEGVSVVASGVAIAPFVGYKTTLHAGLVFEIDAGVQWIAAKAMSSAGNMASEKSVLALLRINLGWAF